MLTLCKHSPGIGNRTPVATGLCKCNHRAVATIRRLVFARLAIASAGVASGLFTLALAERADTASWAGRDVPADVLLLRVG